MAEENGNNQNRLQNEFLQDVYNNNKTVRIFLNNGVKLLGTVKDYDKFTILLSSKDNGNCLVYKHGINSIEPNASE